jgi:hypothetical protein
MAEAIAGLSQKVFSANVSIFGDRNDSGKFPKESGLNKIQH